MEKRELSPFQKPEVKEKEAPLVEEFERGDLRIQKYHVSEEKTRNPFSKYYLMEAQRVLELRPVSDIKLINKSGESHSLKDELPRGVTLIEGRWEQVACAQKTIIGKKQILLPRSSIDTKVYQVPESEKLPEPHWHNGKIVSVNSKEREVVERNTVNFLKTEGAFLVLYHEIAHSRKMVDVISPKGIERGELLTKAEYKTLTEKDKERYEEIILGEERDAWAFALRKVRQLRKKGFDIEPTLDDPRRLKKLFHSWLHTYEEPIEDILAGQSKKIKDSQK